MLFTPSPLDAQPLLQTDVPHLNRCYLYSTPEFSDPTIVWSTEVDLSNLKRFVKDYSRDHPTLLTPTAILIRLTGIALTAHPEFNSRILGHSIYRFQQANVLFAIHRKKLGAVLRLLTAVDQKSYGEIAAELWRQQHLVAHESEDQRWVERTFGRLPHWLSRTLLRFLLWTSNHIHKPSDPIDRPLRSAAVLINHFGFHNAPPMLSYKPSRFASNCFLMNITLGPSYPRPTVVDGEIVPRPIAGLFVRADHRIVGAHDLSNFVATLRNLLTNPGDFDLVEAKPRERAAQTVEYAGV